MSEEVTPINATNTADLAPLAPASEVAPVETTVETSPVETQDIDLMSGINVMEDEPAPEEDGYGLLRDLVREGVDETIQKYRKPQTPQEEDRQAALAAELAEIKRELLVQKQSQQVQALRAQSDQVIGTYIANVNAAAIKANVTPDNNPLLFRALNAEMTAAKTYAESQLGRPLNAKEASRLVSNFNKQWQSTYEQAGIYKPQTPSQAPLSSMNKATFGDTTPKKTTPAEDFKTRLDKANTVQELIKLGYSPTRQQ